MRNIVVLKKDPNVLPALARYRFFSYCILFLTPGMVVSLLNARLDREAKQFAGQLSNSSEYTESLSEVESSNRSIQLYLATWKHLLEN